MDRPYTTPEYWNERTRRGVERNDFKNMLFEDRRFDMYEGRTRDLLSLWKPHKVLDVACGYGRFADIFSRYVGVDFSEEMIRLAKERNPNKHFILLDANTEPIKEKFDIIFEVNSLKSLGMTQDDFINRFAPHAHKMVACIEADYTYIHQIYG